MAKTKAKPKAAVGTAFQLLFNRNSLTRYAKITDGVNAVALPRETAREFAECILIELAGGQEAAAKAIATRLADVPAVASLSANARARS
jgi:hypothetical protein